MGNQIELRAVSLKCHRVQGWGGTVKFIPFVPVQSELFYCPILTWILFGQDLLLSFT